MILKLTPSKGDCRPFIFDTRTLPMTYSVEDGTVKVEIVAQDASEVAASKRGGLPNGKRL
jgi:hypothetical protein